MDFQQRKSNGVLEKNPITKLQIGGVKMKKVLVFLIFCISTLLLSCVTNRADNIEYYLSYEINQENSPPCGMKNRLESGNTFEQEIYFIWWTGWNKRQKKADPYKASVEIYTKKQYKKLIIKELSYVYEGKTDLICENVEFKLPEIVSTLEENPDSWRSDGKNFWLNGELFAHSVGNSQGWPKIDFTSLFSNHKTIDEEFEFQLLLKYQFDDDPIKNETIKYKVTTVNAWK